MMLSHSCVYNHTLLVYIGGENMTLSELNEMFIRDYARIQKTNWISSLVTLAKHQRRLKAVTFHLILCGC